LTDTPFFSVRSLPVPEFCLKLLKKLKVEVTSVRLSASDLLEIFFNLTSDTANCPINLIFSFSLIIMPGKYNMYVTYKMANL
jgi:hypothetical protein